MALPGMLPTSYMTTKVHTLIETCLSLSHSFPSLSHKIELHQSSVQTIADIILFALVLGLVVLTLQYAPRVVVDRARGHEKKVAQQRQQHERVKTANYFSQAGFHSAQIQVGTTRICRPTHRTRKRFPTSAWRCSPSI